MESNAGIIHAMTIEGDGSGVALTGDAISQTIKDDKLAWVHLDVRKPESRKWLQQEITYLDDIVVDALLAEETRPRILEMESGVLLILRGVNLNENERPEDMVSIRLWVDPHRIISVQRRPLKAVRDIQERLENGKGPSGPADFIIALASRLFERMEPIFSELEERLDDIEEKVMENPDIQERQDITAIRKEAIIYRRYMMPQRDVIAHLRVIELPWIELVHKRRLQEIWDHTMRYIEDLDAIRERAQIVKDELTSMLSDQMNKNIYVLSVVAAVFMPLGFLTGLLGINVGGIPGADSGSAFLIFCGILVAIVIAQIAIFRRLKWI